MDEPEPGAVQRYGREELDKRRVIAELLRRFDGCEKPADLPSGVLTNAQKLSMATNTAFSVDPS